MKIIKYIHHGTEVSVQSHLKGNHKEYCLCYCDCVYFKPGTDDNCEIAKANYELCVKYNLVTPVFECPKYKNSTHPIYKDDQKFIVKCHKCGFETPIWTIIDNWALIEEENYCGSCQKKYKLGRYEKK